MDTYSASHSVNQHAAVHIQRDAGAVLREVAAQEDAGTADVVGTAQARQRNGLGDFGLLFFGELALATEVLENALEFVA